VIEPVLADGRLDGCLQPIDEVLPLELHVVKYLADRVPLDDRLQHDLTIGPEVDVYGVRVAEQVVQVAQDFLIGEAPIRNAPI
jgi:hypothetical protein